MSNASHDQNHVPTLIAVSNVDSTTPVKVFADPTTHRLLVDLPGGTGTVTDVSVVSANGFAGTVANSTSTPAITLSTTVTGITKGNGTALSAASAGSDYVAPGAITTSGLTQATNKILGRATAGTGAIEEIATTGSGSVVLATSPTLVGPALGTPTALVGTNITGTASGLTAGNVTTNANLTGVITSVGNATSIASQTGTGTKFVVDTSPTLVTPVLGVATATSINKVALTAPSGSATLTIADGKTLTANSSLTLAGADSKTLTVSNNLTLAGTDGKSLTLTNGLTVNTNDGTLAFGAASKTLTVNKSIALDGTDSTTMTFPASSTTVAGLGTTQSFSGTNTFKATVQTVTAMGAQALDGSLGNVFTRTLAASETFTQSNFTTGQCFIVEVKQGSGTSYTVTWFGGVTWVTSGATAPTQTTTTNGFTTYGFRCTGSNTFLGYLVGTN